MATADLDAGQVAPGRALTRVLEAYRTLLENVYSLMRFLETEVFKHQWVLVKPGAYIVTRNGTGRGLASFATGDWVTTEIGVAFVPAGRTKVGSYFTQTMIDASGLDLLAFQVRWLDKSPAEPVVWIARLHVELQGSGKRCMWEHYQTGVFAQLEPEVRGQARSGQIQPGKAVSQGTAISYTGTYTEVPLARLQTREDVVALLLEPVLSGL